MKNSADLGGCYAPRPKVEVDNTLLDLHAEFFISYHRWPKRNMRVCMGKIDEINEVKAIKVINKV